MSKPTEPKTVEKIEQIEKSPLASRTVWTQILMVVAAFLPAVQEWLASNPVEVVSVFAAINVLVRFITSGKVSILGALGKAGTVSLWVFGICGLAVLSLGLTSCEGFHFKGSAYLRDPDSGAKGGIEFVRGAPPLPYFRTPIRDASGRVIGEVDVRGSK